MTDDLNRRVIEAYLAALPVVQDGEVRIFRLSNCLRDAGLRGVVDWEQAEQIFREHASAEQKAMVKERRSRYRSATKSNLAFLQQVFGMEQVEEIRARMTGEYIRLVRLFGQWNTFHWGDADDLRRCMANFFEKEFPDSFKRLSSMPGPRVRSLCAEIIQTLSEEDRAKVKDALKQYAPDNAPKRGPVILPVKQLDKMDSFEARTIANMEFSAAASMAQSAIIPKGLTGKQSRTGKPVPTARVRKDFT